MLIGSTLHLLAVLAAAHLGSSPKAAGGAGMVLARSVIAAGGSPATGAVRSNGTVGQAIIGTSHGTALTVHHGFWYGGTLSTTSVDDDGVADAPAVPARFAFGAPSPNPARALATFALSLPSPARVRLTVIDVTGRVVSVVTERRYEAGHHRLSYDLATAGNVPLPSGVYFARLDVDGRPAAKRSIVVVR